MQLRFIILHKINPLVYKRLSLLNVTMVILGLVMFFLGGCADNHQKNELTSPFSLDLTNVPYSPELQPYLEAGWYSLSNPTDGVDSSMVNQLQTYDEFISTLMRPNPSNDDVDHFFELWKSEPSNVLWAGIAKSSRKYVQRGNEYRTMLAHPSVNDTTTAIGLYFWSSTNRSRSERLTGFRRVISRRSELSEFASIWVALRLSYLENKTGNKDKAVKDLLGELSSARQLGGNCLEMFFWRRLATIFLEQKHFDDALHAAVLAETMARRGDMPSLRLRFSQLIAKILEKHGELEVALKIHSKIIAEADSLDLPRQKSYSAEAAGMINAHQGNFEAALHFSRTSLGFHLDIGDSLNVPRVLMAIADNHRLAGSLDSCLVYQEKARLWVDAYPHPDNRAQLPIEMAQYYMQVGNYSVVDSLLAAAQRQLPANAPANLGAKIYMANFRTAMEAGRPAEAYKLLDGFEKIRNGVINLPLEVDLLSDLETTTTDFLASQGEFHLAQESLERARNLEVSSEYQLWLQEWSAGKLAFLRGDLNAALFSFEKCLTMAQEADDPDRVATTRFFL
ncbi:MAG: hypothetical protein GY780_15635, partial [bacterium]|nr:hypothetical protein [bacterium]